MSKAIQNRLDELTKRAALRSMAIRRAADGWELHSPFRVVCHGSLDVAAWLTAAEQRDRQALPVDRTGVRADG